MPDTTPIDQARRQAIADAIRAGGKRNAIAREFNVSQGTVSGIAREHGLAFDRAAVAHATAAKQADNRARRAQLGELLLRDALVFRERALGGGKVVVPSGVIVELPEQLPRDVRDLTSAIQANVKTHIELDRHDSDDEPVRSLISALGERFGLGVRDDA